MIPKLRLDALTDGVFAVAMTLLVLDLRLPELFQPHDNAGLIHGLVGLGHQALVYVVSFYVLALCWLGRVKSGAGDEEVGRHHAVLALSYLLFITFLPFATSVVGRFRGFPAAAWLYAANIFLLAVVALRIALISNSDARARRDAIVGLSTVMIAAIVAVIVSFIEPRWTVFAYAITFIEGSVRGFSGRVKRRREIGA
jgi:uncharacterized membrane protein